MNMKNLLFSIVVIFSFFTMSSSYGADHEVWYSSGTNPQVEVTIQENEVLALVWENIPATKLQYINSQLYKEYTDEYVKMADFNKDGVTDIGVLQGASLGGGTLCYAVYEYMPEVFSYRSKPSFRWCAR